MEFGVGFTARLLFGRLGRLGVGPSGEIGCLAAALKLERFDAANRAPEPAQHMPLDSSLRGRQVFVVVGLQKQEVLVFLYQVVRVLRSSMERPGKNQA